MANQLSTGAMAAFGEASRLTELRKRFFFLIGGLVVYRIGTFIPVPGVDPAALARFLTVATMSLAVSAMSPAAVLRVSVTPFPLLMVVSSSVMVRSPSPAGEM